MACVTVCAVSVDERLAQARSAAAARRDITSERRILRMRTSIDPLRLHALRTRLELGQTRTGVASSALALEASPMMRKRNVLGSIAGALVLTSSSLAMAQPSDLPPPPPPPSDLPPPPAPKATVTTQTQVTTQQTMVKEEAKTDDGVTDHEMVVGKCGVAYFGINQQPLGVGAANAVGRGNVDTPVIGVRYWMKERMGLDLGLGLNFFSSSRSVNSNNTEVSTDGPAAISFAVHGGLPLAFAYGKHYKFLVVPELNFGYATQTEAAQNNVANVPDIHRTGLRFDVGARIGSEIQFGFIGIPELALQASVGLNFRHQRWSSSQDAANGTAEISSSESASNFGTTVQSDPWALFTNNIAAIYYFP